MRPTCEKCRETLASYECIANKEGIAFTIDRGCVPSFKSRGWADATDEAGVYKPCPEHLSDLELSE